jgi:hypothetical protein
MAKMIESNFLEFDNLDEIASLIAPLGFSFAQKNLVQNVAILLKKLLDTEKLYLFDQI